MLPSFFAFFPFLFYCWNRKSWRANGVTDGNMSLRRFQFCLAFGIIVAAIWISCFSNIMNRKVLDKTSPNSSLRTREASSRWLHLAVNGLTKSLACITQSDNSSDLNSMIGLSMAAGKLVLHWVEYIPSCIESVYCIAHSVCTVCTELDFVTIDSMYWVLLPNKIIFPTLSWVGCTVLHWAHLRVLCYILSLLSTLHWVSL